MTDIEPISDEALFRFHQYAVMQQDAGEEMEVPADIGLAIVERLDAEKARADAAEATILRMKRRAGTLLYLNPTDCRWR